MNTPNHLNNCITGSKLTILGGGPAGLAVGYYARKNKMPFTIYEGNSQIGGNCITLEHKNFLFDSGAHRFHDKDSEITKEIKDLLGYELRKIKVPSQIYYEGKFIDFPLSPINLVKNLGLHTAGKAALELVTSRLANSGLHESFESFAKSTYGKTIANSFLLNYSSKLWGTECSKLSPSIAGKRLKGLDLKTFIVEAIYGRNAKVEHLDGSFYYPKMGIGSITNKLGKFCGEENIQKNSRITKILHNYKQIQAIEVNGDKTIEVDEVVSTLPLTILAQIMEPLPSKNVIHLVKSLRYRNLILVALFLNRKTVSENASVYFPSPEFPFTRVYEPKNRSLDMSPPNQTSLIAEIPCQEKDDVWILEDCKLIQLVCSRLSQIGWIKEEEVIDALVKRINYAYPILEIGQKEKIQEVTSFMKNFSNLKVLGRNGKFTYSHLHNMMRFGKETIEEMVKEQ